MGSGFAILALGFFLGMRHATDPDHVIAVSTIVSRERSILKAGLVGVLWGLGHTITIAAVGAAIILFGLVIPPRVGLTMEFSVGLMLILLGVLNLTGAMKWFTGKLSPAHSEIIGEHSHVHAHAVALLVLSTIRDPKWAVGYLLIFGVGTIAGMMLITTALALPFSFAGYRFAWLNRGLITGSGILSLGFGLFVAYHIGFVDGLFTSHPVWTPQ